LFDLKDSSNKLDKLFKIALGPFSYFNLLEPKYKYFRFEHLLKSGMSVRAQEVSSKWTIFGVQRQSSSGTSSILVSDASNVIMLVSPFRFGKFESSELCDTVR
jgi:hypothetical protein